MKTEPDAIGIDIGTRYALCAYAGKEKNASPVVIPNRWGSILTPSHVKRGLGDVAGDALMSLLRALREDAEVFLGRFVSSCALAVPEHSSPLWREAVTRAAEAAGMTNVRVVSEPIAAALAFGREGRFLVLDFGAGGADISVVESSHGAWRVLESVEDDGIGGCIFDLTLAEWLRERLRLDRMSEEDPRWRALVLEAERIKIVLSSCLVCEWKSPLPDNQDLPAFRIEREEFERMTRFSIRRLLHVTRRLWDKHIPERVLLMGGSSRIPLLRELLECDIAHPECLSFCGEETIAVGAALYAITEQRRVDELEDLPAAGRARDLKTRLAPLEASLSRFQRARLDTMVSKLGNDGASIEILEGIVKDLESALSADVKSGA